MHKKSSERKTGGVRNYSVNEKDQDEGRERISQPIDGRCLPHLKIQVGPRIIKNDNNDKLNMVEFSYGRVNV